MAAAGCGAACGGANEQPPHPGGLQPGWNELRPGGDTTCARGGEFAFWVRPGKVNSLVIELGGGGACWDELTCSVAEGVFQDSVEGVRQAVARGYAHGISDHDSPENPFREWHHVLIPYCTGDLHWGDSVKTYGEGTPHEVTIRHKGAVNARTALAWVYETFPQPERVFVTGCSAGSYGSALWAADVMAHYPQARVYQLGDSGVGVITEQFFRKSFPSWNAEAAFPEQIPELDPSRVPIRDLGLPDLYAGIARHYPHQWMSQYTTVKDHDQVFYFELMGGSGAEEWSARMRESIAEIEARAPSFDSFIAPGEQHCIVIYDSFYTVESGGVRLVDWLRDRLAGKDVGSVTCSGPECELPTR